MRLPNNYGTITRLPGNRRKPYAVRVTVKEILSDGKVTSKQKYLSYHETREQALQALSVWNQLKTPVSEPNITIQQVYNLWYNVSAKSLASNTLRKYSAAWKKCSTLYTLPIRNVRLSDLQSFFDTLSQNYNITSLEPVKVVLSLVFSYAFKNDIILKNYASLVNLSIYKNPLQLPKERKVYSLDDIQKINFFCDKKLNSGGIPDSTTTVAYILKCLLYTGARVEELLNLSHKDLHLDSEIPYFKIVESKTPAGVREVPLHPSIIPIFTLYAGFSSSPDACVFRTRKSTGISYMNFYRLVKRSGPDIIPSIAEHNIHDTRHTLITNLNLLSDRSEVVLKALVGHSQTGITDSVYTHVSLEDKYNLLLRLPY